MCILPNCLRIEIINEIILPSLRKLDFNEPFKNIFECANGPTQISILHSIGLHCSIPEWREKLKDQIFTPNKNEEKEEKMEVEEEKIESNYKLSYCVVKNFFLRTLAYIILFLNAEKKI